MAIQRIVISLMALGLLAGCGGGSKGSAPTVTVTMLATPSGPMATVGNPPKDSFQFSARVDGAGDTAVVWSVKESGGGTIDTIGRYLAPLTEGQYTVLASARADQSRSAQATVTVMAPPRITSHPSSTVASLGASVTFTVAASGQQLAFQWYRQGAAIPGASAQAIVINSIALGDTGVPFHCVVTNPVGTATSNPATITAPLPVITAHPASVMVAEGAGAVFSVTATGSQLSYQWLKNLAPIPGATQAQLALNGVGLADSGAVFQCVVSNPSGSVTSGAGILLVKSLVAITSFTATPSVVPFGQSSTLAWLLQGQPDAVMLDGQSVLGTASSAVVPRNRMQYTLTVHGFNTATRSVEVAARGIDAFVGVPGGPGNLDGVGASARLGVIEGIFRMASGSSWLIDGEANAIRRVDPDDTVTTLAGSSEEGFRDGLAGEALFAGLSGGTLDPQSNLLVADLGNSRIRRVSPEGRVTTVAGPGSLFGPMAVAAGPDGTLYVATLQHVILRIPPGGSPQVFAGQVGVSGSADGSGLSAQFNFPRQMVRDATGNIFVADYGNHTLRKITPAGLVTTIAGSPGQQGNTDGRGNEVRFAGPGVLALAATGDGLLVGDGQNIRHCTWDGVVSTRPELWGGSPSAIDAWPDGSLMISDHVLNELSQYKDGTFRRVAGQTGDNARTDGVGEAAAFWAPTDFVLDANGNAFVADVQRINKVSTDQVKSTLLSNGKQYSQLALDAAGNLVAAEFGYDGTRKIVRISIATGAVLPIAGSSLGHRDGPASTAGFEDIRGIAIAADGTIFVSQGNHTLRRIAADGTVSTLAGSPGQSGFQNGTGAGARFYLPSGLIVDQDGSLLVADAWNHCIRRVDTTSGQTTTHAGTPGVWGHRDSELASAARFRSPTGLSRDAQGNLLIADRENHALRRLTPAGSVETLAGTPLQFGSRPGPLPGTLYLPSKAIARPNGDILVLVQSDLMQLTAP